MAKKTVRVTIPSDDIARGGSDAIIKEVRKTLSAEGIDRSQHERFCETAKLHDSRQVCHDKWGPIEVLNLVYEEGEYDLTPFQQM